MKVSQNFKSATRLSKEQNVVVNKIWIILIVKTSDKIIYQKRVKRQKKWLFDVNLFLQSDWSVVFIIILSKSSSNMFTLNSQSFSMNLFSQWSRCHSFADSVAVLLITGKQMFFSVDFYILTRCNSHLHKPTPNRVTIFSKVLR